MSYAEEYAREFIEKNYSEGMAFSTVLFVIAILIAITSVVCFVLAPFYSKGINKGAKTAGRIISTFDFIIGILLIIAFMAIAAIITMASSGAFSDLPNSIKNVLIGIVYAPMRFGMEVKSTYDNPCDASLAFYALYFVTAGLLGLVAFIVSCVARGKYNAANGLIRGAAAPAGAPQYNPYQPYGQPNVQQGYPQQYGQNAQQGYPQQYGQNIPQGYPQQYQQPAPQNMPQDNAQYQPAQQEVPQNIPQEDANTEVPVPEPLVPRPPAQEAPVQQDLPAFCSNCGHPVIPGASFCQNCGNKIN